MSTWLKITRGGPLINHQKVMPTSLQIRQKIQKVEISTQKSRGRPAMERYEALRAVPARCKHPKEAEAGPTGKPW